MAMESTIIMMVLQWQFVFLVIYKLGAFTVFDDKIPLVNIALWGT